MLGEASIGHQFLSPKEGWVSLAELSRCGSAGEFIEKPSWIREGHSNCSTYSLNTEGVPLSPISQHFPLLELLDIAITNLFPTQITAAIHQRIAIAFA